MNLEINGDRSLALNTVVETGNHTYSTVPIESVNPSASLINVVNSKQKPYLLDRKWIIGLVLQVIGAIMDFTALGFAPASVVAPLGSLTLVTNVFLAPLMHSEMPSTKILCSTVLIIVGTITTVIFSPRHTAVNTTEEIFAVFVSNAFIVYVIYPVRSDTECVVWSDQIYDSHKGTPKH